MATTIALVRHGETNWNREHRFQGHADVPLNELGRAQAATLARSLAAERFTALYTSPLRRARETAGIIGGALGLEPREHRALMEVDVGSWSGLTVGEVEMRFPDGYRNWRTTRSGWTDGETYEELGRRVVAGIVELAPLDGPAHVVAVTHGGPIRALTAYALGLPFTASRTEIDHVTNCGVVRVAVEGARIELLD